MKKINTLYKVIKGQSKQIGSYIPIQLIGTNISLTVLGGECDDILPASIVIGDLANLAPDDSPFTATGIQMFTTIPQYICVSGTGTAAGFQISNVKLQEIKALS